MTPSCKYAPCQRASSTKATGYCHTHYWRSRNGKRMDEPIKERKSPQENFWEKVQKTQYCWVWTGYKFAEGYGGLLLGGKVVRAHRISYEWAYGRIPDGMQVDHTCWNPSCVNPHHLRLATNAWNAQNRSGPGENNTSGYRGVSFHRATGKWQAYATVNGKRTHLGLHESAESAAAVGTAWRRENMPYSVMDRKKVS